MDAPTRKLVSIEEAQRLILARVERLPTETVPIAEAGGRILAEAGRAAVDLPPFDSSAMDGFALRAADSPGRLPVSFRIAAGSPAPRPLEPGEAMGIATGGVVPAGADAVIPFEYVVETDNTIELSEAGRRGGEHPPVRRRCAPRRAGGRRRRPPRPRAARRTRGGGHRRGARCAEAAGRRARDGQRASPAGRAARAWTNL